MVITVIVFSASIAANHLISKPERVRVVALESLKCNGPCAAGEPRVWREPFRPDETLSEPKSPLLEKEPYRGEDVLKTIGPNH